jgi:hypothetical protein
MKPKSGELRSLERAVGFSSAFIMTCPSMPGMSGKRLRDAEQKVPARQGETDRQWDNRRQRQPRMP